MGLICASFPTDAQPILDSIQKCPFLYGYYNWDDVLGNIEDCITCRDLRFPETSITSGFTSMYDLNSFRANVGEIAFYQHSDSVLHAIGIAIKTLDIHTPHGHFFLGLYDSNMVLQRDMTPTAYLSPLADVPPNLFYRVYIPAFRFSSEDLMFSFFDEPIDLSGDFYLSIGEEIEPHVPDGLNDIFTLVDEDHPYHFGNLNIKWYQKNSKSWVDDTLLHRIPELFLIVEPECHTLDSMRVTIDSMGNVTVEWDTLKYQEQWVLRLVGPGGTRYDTVDTNRHTYYNLDTNAHYELSILTQCFIPGGRHNLSSWSDSIIIGNGSAGIDDVSSSGLQVSLYPNPASRQVEVSSSLPMTHIEATDILGHRLYGRPATSLTTTLDVSSWPSGTYFLRITTPSGIATRTLLVK